MSVLGHRTLAKAERYTRDADQARLATAAVTKWEDTSRTDSRRTDLPKPKRQVWEDRQKQKKNQSEQMESGAP
jgi:hypothetical protein